MVARKTTSHSLSLIIADIAPYLVGGVLLLVALRDKTVGDFLGELSVFLPVGLGGLQTRR
jgi:hypothetical protein